MSKSFYCRCLNTYTTECKERDCNYPDYWKQGIGDISNKENESE